VRALRAEGVTIILTTHYIEEPKKWRSYRRDAQGKIILVEDKVGADAQARKKQLTLHLQKRLDALRTRSPRIGSRSRPTAAKSSTPTTRKASAPASPPCSRISISRASGSATCTTTQTSLEDIFVDW